MGVDSKRFTGPQDSVDYRLFSQQTNFQTKRLVKVYSCRLSFNSFSILSKCTLGELKEFFVYKVSPIHICGVLSEFKNCQNLTSNQKKRLLFYCHSTFFGPLNIDF